MKTVIDEDVVIRSTLSQPIVVAILLNAGRYVMQLRDDKPGINNPGMWGLFGGYREQFERFATGIRRELKEELGLDVRDVRFVLSMDYLNVFEADITSQYANIVLGEGQDYGSFTLEELKVMNVGPTTTAIIEEYERLKS